MVNPTQTSTFDTKHEGIIYDAQFDYYGRRLATCSADGTIKVFQVEENEEFTQVATLQHHQGGVLGVSWSHPKFGSLLASAGIDHKVLIWKEMSQNSWNVVYEYDGHSGPVNCVSWAPWEHGLMLLTGSSDCTVSVISRLSEDKWESSQFESNSNGVTSVSWAPGVSLSQMQSGETYLLRRFVTGGGDNLVKVWTYSEGTYECEELPKKHNKWVRDVAWCPAMGLPKQVIASCGEDCSVVIWENSGESWEAREVLVLKAPVWRVSWSVAGNALAVSAGDNITRILRETPEGNWEVVSEYSENGQAPSESTD